MIKTISFLLLFIALAYAETITTCTDVPRQVCSNPGDPSSCYTVWEERCTTVEINR